jgi:quercetin dioxygenase-like cupin family protein
MNSLETYTIKEFKRGWFVGKFAPNILDHAGEVGVQYYQAGDVHPPHFHVLCREINMVIDGECEIIGIEVSRLGERQFHRQIFKAGDIFVVNPGYAIEFMARTDCSLLVVKSSSNPKDKIDVSKEHWY